MAGLAGVAVGPDKSFVLEPEQAPKQIDSVVTPVDLDGEYERRSRRTRVTPPAGPRCARRRPHDPPWQAGGQGRRERASAAPLEGRHRQGALAGASPEDT